MKNTLPPFLFTSYGEKACNSTGSQSLNAPMRTELQTSQDRIGRALALQVWRLSRCRHYSSQDRFVSNFGRLVDLQDAVAAALNAIDTKTELLQTVA